MTKKFLIALESIKETIGDFYLTGSLALKDFKIISRRVGDIDIAVSSRENFLTLAKKYQIIAFIDYKKVTFNESDSKEFNESLVNNPDSRQGRIR